MDQIQIRFLIINILKKGIEFKFILNSYQLMLIVLSLIIYKNIVTVLT
jgi:hypothetical protein